MREIGRRGGTKRADRAVGVDETLAASEAGRRKLLELMEHDDPRIGIAASKALYSIGPTRAPAADKPDSADGHAVHHDPARILAMLEEVGLVAPALVDTAAPLTPRGKVGEVLDPRVRVGTAPGGGGSDNGSDGFPFSGEARQTRP